MKTKQLVCKNRLSDIIVQLYRKCVIGFCWVILLLLFFFAAYSTCYMHCQHETTFYTRDSVILNLCFIVFLTLLLMAVKKNKKTAAFLMRIEQDEHLFLKSRKMLLWILFVVASVWVLASQIQPGADQWTVQNAAYSLQLKDYYLFLEDGYLSAQKHQLGLTWISYLLSIIFGNYNYVCFQLLNVAGLILCYRVMSEICGLWGFRKTVQLMVIIYGILFFPLIMYCSFIYGNILSFAFALLAIKNEIIFFKQPRWRYAVVSAAAIAIALLIKLNMLIFLIGMLIYAFIEIIKIKEIRLVIFPVLLISFWLLQGQLTIAVSRMVSEQPLDQGISSWSFIAMGLQDSSLGPGWYNGYNINSYKESGYQSKLQADMAKEQIQNSVEYFSAHKSEAVQFFSKKIASQWNNPNFQSYWIVQIRNSTVRKSNWLWRFLSVDGMHRGTQFLNLLQISILAGALMYLVLYWKSEKDVSVLIFALIFIGGFIFHIFWEAKGQYTITYFVLLIPYAAAGYERLTEILISSYSTKEMPHILTDLKKNWVYSNFVIFTICFLIVFFSFYSGDKGKYLTADTETYRTYLAENTITPKMPDGNYQLQTETGMVLQCNNANEVGVFRLSDELPAKLHAVTYQGVTRFSFAADRYLTMSDDTDPEHQIVSAATSSRNNNQQWTVKSPEKDVFCILYNNENALTYDEVSGSVYVAPYTAEANQRWRVLAL